MRILVDADSCCVVSKIEKIAKRNNIEVVLFCDTNHMIDSDYSEIRIISSGSDAVDFAILNSCTKEDIVVTNDGGLASLVLAKRGQAVNSYGKKYTEADVNEILNSRYFMSRSKRKGNRNFRGMKRTHEPAHPDFRTTLNMLIMSAAAV